MTSTSAIRRLVALAILLIAGAAQPASAESGLQPAGWDADLKLPEAVDTNPDARIVEIELVAKIAPVEISPGQRVEMWTYGGGLPGPLIRVRKGDRLVVHFTNHLPEPTTIHWHGLRVAVKMDGVPGHSQVEVAPDESFTYDFVVPDEGLYWYHPHVRSAAQVGYGLYGPLLVEDPDEKVGVEDELLLVLSDIALTSDGKLEDADSGGSAGMVFGREGHSVLVNGKVRPSLTVRSGVPQRWRIVNAAKSRYFNLDADGTPFTKIGDDAGLQEYPVTSERIVLATGERADLVITPRGAPGDELVIMSMLFNRGYGSVEFREQPELIAIRFADLPEHQAAPLPEIRRQIEPLALDRATEVTIDFTLAQKTNGDFEFGVNGRPFAKNVALRAAPGETQVWTVNNKTDWSHPFHLHGFLFLVLDDNGAPVRPMAWKDTVDVPLRQSVRFAVRFDDRVGGWMYHCHILDHADGGLMGILQVGDGPLPVHEHEP